MNKNICRRLLELIYPPRCMFCDELIPAGKTQPVCGACLNSLPFIPGTELWEIEGFPESTSLSGIYSLLRYEGVVREAILRFKFRGEKGYSADFSALIYKGLTSTGFLNAAGDVDFIIPAPLYKNKEKARGYNQAELLADELSKLYNIPVLRGNLLRVRDTERQSELNAARRYENTLGAFCLLKPEDVYSKNILLVDDIITTGATLNECAKTLKNNGASKIYAVTIAKTYLKNT